MPYTTNPDDGIRIFYEVEGKGPPVALLHGLTQTRVAWRRNGIVEAFKDRYQLILIDARGHGNSDKPHTPEDHGGLTAMAADTVAVLDALGAEQAHVIGLSMGAITGYALGLDYSERLRSLVLGAGPRATSDDWKNGLIEVFRRGPEQLLDLFQGSVGELQRERKEEILDLDMDALIAATLANFVHPISDSVFLSITTPSLLFAGENDNLAYTHVIEIAELMPNAELLVLSDVDHNQTAVEIRRIFPQITSFLCRVEAERS